MRIYIILALVLLLSSCDNHRENSIGLICGLSGSNADLGVSGRNGAMLAVEKWNRKGGVKGHPVKLYIGDDGNNPEQAVNTAHEQVELGVQAIIGALSTNMTEAILRVTEPIGLLQITPTASAFHFTDKDDNLIRLNSSTRENAQDYARFMVERRNYSHVNIIMDIQNRGFTESWLTQFESAYTLLGGSFSQPVEINTSQATDYEALVKELLQNSPQALLIITNSVDAARISQQIRKQDKQIPLIAVEWAATEGLIELGGKAVEGLTVLQTYDAFGTQQDYLDFLQLYRERFLSEPDFSSILTYESTSILLEAMDKRTRNQSLKEAVIANSPYQGLQQEIRFNEFGDMKREATFVFIDQMEFKKAP